jgi:hypothetical protein
VGRLLALAEVVFNVSALDDQTGFGIGPEFASALGN